jgi:hypothetical protein
MNNTNDLQTGDRTGISNEPAINAEASVNNRKIFKRLKRVVYLTSMAGMALIFNSCMVGYVATEPVYVVEVSRPPRPGNQYIWVDGDWSWNRQSHSYVQRNGYWRRSGQGQQYVAGHWQASPQGNRWAKGYWQKEGRQDNNRKR